MFFQHHCRNCGDIYCNNCSGNELALPSYPRPVRVCDMCHSLLLQRSSSTVSWHLQAYAGFLLKLSNTAHYSPTMIFNYICLKRKEKSSNLREMWFGVSISTVTWNSGTLVHMHLNNGAAFLTLMGWAITVYADFFCVVETWLCIEFEMVWAVCDQYFIVIMWRRAGKNIKSLVLT